MIPVLEGCEMKYAQLAMSVVLTLICELRGMELTQSGDVRRAYCGNVHPLLIVTDRTFFFTGDGKLIREFFADWRANRE